jgi:uncharacterized membrane protein
LPVRSARLARRLFALGLFVAVAALAHLASLWIAPRLVMQRAMAAVAGPNPPAPALPPLTDHTQRRVVMPSPDLAYAVCVWDVSRRPLRIRADPKWPRYWSLALYADNSDNFYVLNDRMAGSRAVDLWLVSPHAGDLGTRPPAGALRITAPTDKGLLLMRVLVGDARAEASAAETARRTLSCESASA